MPPWRHHRLGDDLWHRASALAQPLPPILVAASRLAATVAQGVHGRRRVGSGESFWQYRRYQAGDPAAAIDWRQSAKTQPLYVRETEWETAQTVWLWRDASASMDYASQPGGDTKRRRADVLLLALAVLLIDGGERVALLGGDDAPITNRAGLVRLADTLERAPDQTNDAMPPAADGCRNSRVVLFSDGLAPPQDWAARFAAFTAAGARGHLIQVVDPAEETLPFHGRVRFEGLEGEAPILLDRAESLRTAYADKRRRHRDALASLAATAGWRFAVHHTDSAATAALLALHQNLSDPGGA